MKQEVVVSSNPNIDSALKELFGQLKDSPSNYNAVIFYASSIYDFYELSRQINDYFPSAKVVGTSTTGEISQKGFTKNSIVLSAIQCSVTKFSGVLVNDVDKFPIIYRKKIENAAREIGIKIGQNGANKDAFALAFINGLYNEEEAALALINTVIGDSNFSIAGGTAADDLQFKETYVSFNGEVATHGAVVLFVKTPKKFIIKRENIFQPTGKCATITGADAENRIVTTIDGQNARKRYSQMLGINESQAGDYIFDHPLGRVYGDKIYISAFVKFEDDGTASMYARILPGTSVELLDPIDEVQAAVKTATEVKQEIPNLGLALFVNCAFRTIEFERNKTTQKITDTWNEYYSVYAGFSSYGEQKDKLHFNQTLVAVFVEA